MDAMNGDASAAEQERQAAEITMLQFPVWDAAREKSSNIEAATLNDLVMQASAELGVPVARVCLEQDGTEVDEDEYFGTLEAGTPLMVLQEDDRWMPFAARYQLLLEQERKRSNSPPGDELEHLSNMDPDCLTDIVPDKLFLEAVRDACQACRVPGAAPGAQGPQPTAQASM